MPAVQLRPPVVLTGTFVSLVPLVRAHVDALAEAGRDPRIWTYIRSGAHTTQEQMADHVEQLLQCQEAGTDLPFTILRRPGEIPVGMTRFLAIDRENRNAEVGGSWLSPTYWRTPYNTEAKRLILGHAFDVEGLLRIQLKTDVRNLRSQAAIERLGAEKEGILRDHIVNPDGYVRSSMLYSIVASEWPGVRARLDRALTHPWTLGPNSGRSSPSPAETPR